MRVFFRVRRTSGLATLDICTLNFCSGFRSYVSPSGRPDTTGQMATFSSCNLRARDQRLLEKFEKEKAEYERKIQKIKYRADETAKELFDAVHRGNRLARSLGFENVYEAQVFIDSAEHDVLFRDCFSRVQLLEAQLVSEKKEAEISQARIRNLEDDQALQEQVDRLRMELRYVSIATMGKLHNSHHI